MRITAGKKHKSSCGSDTVYKRAECNFQGGKWIRAFPHVLLRSTIDLLQDTWNMQLAMISLLRWELHIAERTDPDHAPKTSCSRLQLAGILKMKQK